MSDAEIKNIIEALLFSYNAPLSMEKMQLVFDEWQRPGVEQLMGILAQLKSEYASRAFDLVQVAGGYLVQTKSEYSTFISRIHSEKPGKYSRALLETLAIIAYKQPVTRSEMEEIRGVAVNSQIIKTLLEREWIRIAGHRDVPGKPAVYITTKEFLNYFNLQHLNELPSLEALQFPQEECVTP